MYVVHIQYFFLNCAEKKEMFLIQLMDVYFPVTRSVCHFQKNVLDAYVYPFLSSTITILKHSVAIPQEYSVYNIKKKNIFSFDPAMKRCRLKMNEISFNSCFTI